MLVTLQCCNSNKTNSDDEDDSNILNTVTPVTITHATISNENETVTLNAVSAFTLKTYVKANTTGYLTTRGIQLGQYVVKGETLFTIQTKESAALGNTINRLDTSLHFEGITKVKSPIDGYITQIGFTAGNYVQDGEQLAEISDKSSFSFLLNLPYELKPYLSNNKMLLLQLADSTVLQGYLQSALPVVDSVAQTQQYIIKIKTNKLIPENLVAKVQLVKQQITNAVMLPKAAVLSNEEETQFWIMKLLNDSIAVKVPIQKGMEVNDSIQVLAPLIKTTDKIILTGNYGLSDTAKISVTRNSHE